jgi:hypothetical protein
MGQFFSRLSLALSARLSRTLPTLNSELFWHFTTKSENCQGQFGGCQPTLFLAFLHGGCSI